MVRMYLKRTMVVVALIRFLATFMRCETAVTDSEYQRLGEESINQNHQQFNDNQGAENAELPYDERGRINYFLSVSKLKIKAFTAEQVLTPLTLVSAMDNDNMHEDYSHQRKRRSSIYDDELYPCPPNYELLSKDDVLVPFYFFTPTGSSFFYRYVLNFWIGQNWNRINDASEHSSLSSLYLHFMINVCFQHVLPNKTCRIIFEQIQNLIQRLRYEQNFIIDTLENYPFKKNQLTKLIPNDHLVRSNSTVLAEIENLHSHIQDDRIALMYYAESLAVQALQGYVEETLLAVHSNLEKRLLFGSQFGGSVPSKDGNKGERMMTRRERRKYLQHRISSRFAIIHSCLLPKSENPEPTRILVSLLDEIQRNQLDKHLFMTIVINVGIRPPDELLEKYPNVWFVHVSNDISFFEVPSIRILHQLSQYLVRRYDELQIPSMIAKLMGHDSGAIPLNLYPQGLYMHTKGVSYATIYPMIEEWRHYMTHFLIEKHKTAFHLLQSGEYDVYGVNYGPEPRMLSGNFWWATTSYMARELEPLLYETAMKYSAELWLFESRGVNVYHPFISNKNHAYDRFPRYCYAEVKDFYRREGDRFLRDPAQYQYMLDVAYLPTYEVWKFYCVMLYEVQYRGIHNIRPLINDEEMNSKVLYDSMNCMGGRKSTRSKREKID